MFVPLVVGLLAASAQQTDTTFSVRPNARLEIEAQHGSIIIRAWDRSQMRVQARHSSRETIRIEVTSSLVEIEAHGRTGPARAVDYEITVPAGMSLDLSGNSVHINVQGVQGEISAESVQ